MSRVSRSLFGAACDGMQASLYTLRNPGSKVAVGITNYGATLQSLVLPGRDGATADCVLGFDELKGYRGADNPYFGCIVGRVANRIAGGKFSVGSESYTTAENNGPNTLHGGERGFDKVLWDTTVSDVPGQSCAVRLSYSSPDGEEGFPGECRTRCVLPAAGASGGGGAAAAAAAMLMLTLFLMHQRHVLAEC